MIAVACVFDTPLVWDSLLSGSVRPNSILRNLVTSGAFGKNGPIYGKETVDAILDVYEAVSKLDHLIHADAASIDRELGQVLLSNKCDDQSDRIQTMSAPSNTVDRVNACCQLSSSIFWKLLKGRAQTHAGTPSSDPEEVILLLKHLTTVESQYWIQNAPEALTWIVFTGVAASIDKQARERFIQFGGNLLAAVDSDSLVMIRQGWRFCGLLKKLAGFSLPDKPPEGFV
ncbi:hypothetical protein N7523_004921 [Penicillium sp. IBT 18751x]|nr:hypothetical protein N7523_004921 [Penicillium sp. IBT 18751x]